jgi:porphobilinogen synthase
MTLTFNRAYPATRLRRLRKHDRVRNMVCESILLPQHLIAPVFVLPGHNKREAIQSMPGIDRMSINLLVKHAETQRQKRKCRSRLA